MHILGLQHHDPAHQGFFGIDLAGVLSQHTNQLQIGQQPHQLTPQSQLLGTDHRTHTGQDGRVADVFAVVYGEVALKPGDEGGRQIGGDHDFGRVHIVSWVAMVGIIPGSSR